MSRVSETSDVPGLDGHVREYVYAHVFGNADREVGGVLVGRIARHGGIPLVTAAIAAANAGERRSTLTFTQDTWEHVHRVLEAEHPNDQIVGWYHSHPGFGIFLSEHDLFIHRNFFSGTSQIALVVDPLHGTEGVFGWEDSQVEKRYERPTARPGLGLPAAASQVSAPPDPEYTPPSAYTPPPSGFSTPAPPPSAPAPAHTPYTPPASMPPASSYMAPIEPQAAAPLDRYTIMASPGVGPPPSESSTFVPAAAVGVRPSRTQIVVDEPRAIDRQAASPLYLLGALVLGVIVGLILWEGVLRGDGTDPERSSSPQVIFPAPRDGR